MTMKFMFVAALTALFMTCSSQMQSAGGSSDSGNPRVVATVRNPNGTPAAGVPVRLRHSDYVTPPALAKPAINNVDTLTDAQGRFAFSGIDTGSYSIEVREPAATNSGQGLAVLLSCAIAGRDTENLGTDTLRPCAAVRGSIDTSGISGKRLFVQVPGLERLVQVDPAGTFTLSDLPAGLFSLRIIAVAGSQTTVIRTDQVSAISGDTVGITMSGWNAVKRLFLNTTASGAGISGNVHDFPVLVRLTNKNFNFGQAKAGGSDIRFAKQNGSALPYEIERWDSAGGLAEIWVKVDTVYGNDSTHCLVMYWGNPASASASSSAAVFDTANGFEGVWHLAEPAHAIVKDATIHHYDGTPSDTAPVPVGGAIGIAQSFDGVSNYVEMKGTANSTLNFPAHGNYTVSAWAYIDSFKTIVPGLNDHIDIATKGNFQYNLQVNGTIWQFAEFQDQVGWDIVRGNAESGKWTYIVGVRDGPQEYLYVNGMCVDSSPGNDPGLAPRDTTKNLCIGRFSGLPLYYFDGKIDEVRISNMSRSADWEKLCYMNQKEYDALVVFK